jgi:tryptophan synthase alpha chain
MVSSASVTGSQSGFGSTQETISSIADILKVHKSSVLGSITKRSIKRHNSQRAIIGSAFIQDLTKTELEKLRILLKRFDKRTD